VANRNIFYKGVIIGTGINEDAAEVKRITKATVYANFEAMKQSCFLIGGDTKLHYPDIKISGSSDSAVEPKFFL